jgi:hypothetical protein
MVLTRVLGRRYSEVRFKSTRTVDQPKGDKVMRHVPSLIGLCTLCVLLAVSAFAAGPDSPSTRPTTVPDSQSTQPAAKLFFTDDDGKTWFADDATKFPPFADANGKQAVQAYVFKCGEHGKAFVGYMLKYTPEGQKRMKDAMNQPNGQILDIPPTAFGDSLVKKPGDADWVSRTSDVEAYQKATTPVCPDGGTDIYPVNPNPEP